MVLTVILTLIGVIGSIVTIAVVEPYFSTHSTSSVTHSLMYPLIVIVAFFMAIGYNLLASFYRASAREIKRLGKRSRHAIGRPFELTLHPSARLYASFIDVLPSLRITDGCVYSLESVHALMVLANLQVCPPSAVTAKSLGSSKIMSSSLILKTGQSSWPTLTSGKPALREHPTAC